MSSSDEVTSVKTRVVACRGAIQLASAVAAMWTISGRSSEHAGFRNHLIIHDLAAPDGQAEEFAECIRILAEGIEQWVTIQFVPLPRIMAMQADSRKCAMSPAEQLLQLVGVAACDELYLGQNDKFISNLLRQATPAARHICFGDGIGLNFTNAYYNPKECPAVRNDQPLSQRMRRRIKRQVGQLWSRIRTTAQRPATRDFDLYCLLLQNLFDEQVSGAQEIDPALFVELFERIAADFPDRAPATHKELVRLTRTSERISVLLTSNFSETGRMSLAGELRGYMRCLKALPQGKDVTLIIKPHPRDAYEKLERLHQAVADSYGRSICLSDPWTFYFPFESLYAMYLAPRTALGYKTSVATVSSACISLEYLYGQRCALGFGSQLVSQEFDLRWRALRMLHERDLHRIVGDLRRQGVRGRRPIRQPSQDKVEAL